MVKEVKLDSGITIQFSDPFAEATYIHNLGMMAWRAGHSDVALEHFKKALALKEEYDNVSAAASTIHMIGVIYAEEKDWENAIRYFMRSLDIDAEDRHYDGVAISLNDFAVMCGKRGDTAAKGALIDLGNLILRHKKGEIQIHQEKVTQLLGKTPPELKEGIKKAVYRLMRW